ncbi:MAG: methylenetetrahydrofolate reductase C-terminal domain-containing protein [Candidatus Omnitrophica bacterium]|nr:methylenetetrahydrofolate reductase C-terminal domain-containing protein [Candidatus Omnitrophota bacterium]
MIITRQKPFQEILKNVEGKKKIFLIGCALCATTCKTGGIDQLESFKCALVEEGKDVVGLAVPDPTCNLLEIKRLYREKKNEINFSDVIISLSCGGGAQAISEIITDIEIVSGNDTLFQGEITKIAPKESRFDQKCSLCGECILTSTGAVCPVTRCPKGLLNGPCGGVKNGKCETDNELDCVWLKIYDRLKKFDRVNEMKEIKLPKDHSKNKFPQSLIF